MSIELKNICYTYAPGTPMEQAVLKDVSFTVEEGQFAAIIGHTGSGKSTLIQHFNGLLKPDSGEVLFHGENIFTDGYDRKALRGKVGLVFQYPEHQLFEVDVFSDVCFGPKNQKLSEEEVKQRAKEALELVGMGEEYYTRSPFELSGGQKRRVAIAGVLAMRPEVLILDEPTAGLDPGGRDEILDQVAKLHKERGMAVVLVSHSMEDVAKYAERLIVMEEGRVALDGIPREVFLHEEELKAIGLAVPQVTKIASALRARGFDIPEDITTVEDAKAAILHYLQAK